MTVPTTICDLPWTAYTARAKVQQTQCNTYPFVNWDSWVIFWCRATETGIQKLDPNNGTLDIEYSVVEKDRAKLNCKEATEVVVLWAHLGFHSTTSPSGTFSTKKLETTSMGDGQRLSLRAQASTFYQTYSVSVVEPWLGGKKPVQLSTSFSHTIQYLYNFQTRERDKDRRFLITGGSVGIAKRLRWPDDYSNYPTPWVFSIIT